MRVIRSLGVQVAPFDLPEVAIEAIDFIRYAETAAAFDDLTRSGKLRDVEHGPEQSPRPAEIRPARFIPAVEYIQANRYRMRVMEQMDAAMSGSTCSSARTSCSRIAPVIPSSACRTDSSTDPHRPADDGKLFGEPDCSCWRTRSSQRRIII